MTGHYPRPTKPVNLFVRNLPSAVIERLGAYCRRERVGYRAALTVIIPAGIKALMAKRED